MGGHVMSRAWKRRLGIILFVILVGGGCNPILAPLQLIRGGKGLKRDPEFTFKKLDNRSSNKEVKVAVFVSRGRELPHELSGVERSLSAELTAKLQTKLVETKEKVIIIPASQVDKYKADHPAWRATPQSEIAAELGVDYLIDVEIISMRLHEPGNKYVYQGNASVSMKVYVKNEPEPRYAPEYSRTFPKVPTRDVHDISSEQFKIEFVRVIALDLANKFCTHDVRERFAD
jgi:hypothetical protein